MQAPAGQRGYVLTKLESLTAVNGKIVDEPENVFDRYKDILLYHSRETLHVKLNWLGVEVSLTSLGRFQDKIAFVIGAQYPEESRSQLWVDKETFRPIRWLLVNPSPAGERPWWKSCTKTGSSCDNWYPGQISFLKTVVWPQKSRWKAFGQSNFPGSCLIFRG